MPGKFASEQDERIWAQSLDGTCQTTGDVEWGLWAALVPQAEDTVALVTEDHDGFVDVTLYSTEYAQELFDEIEAKYSKFGSDTNYFYGG